ncbi:hypothetical protein D3C76_11640 [compost metagenome]
MIYQLFNSDTYFKLPFEIEKEFAEEMDAIITMLEILNSSYHYGFCERTNVGKGCACDGHIHMANGCKICFFIHFTGFLYKIQVYRNFDEYKIYYMKNFMDAINDFKSNIVEAKIDN